MNQYFKSGIQILAASLTMLPINCSMLGESNGSGVGNGMMVTGKLYEPDGLTPAAGAVVTVWDRNEFGTIDSNGKVNEVTPVLKIDTDQDGNYSIKQIHIGVYTFDAVGVNNNMARIDSVVFKSINDHKEFSDTLQAAGTIKVTVAFEDAGDTVNGYIDFSPSAHDSEIHINNETFIFGPFAEGTYSVRIQGAEHTSYGYSHEDTLIDVWVPSGGEIDLGTIILHKRIAKIDLVDIDYDSVLKTATISWKAYKNSGNHFSSVQPSSSSQFTSDHVLYPGLGYNVYRRITGEGSFGMPVNGSEPVNDTIYVDTIENEGTFYEYAVAAVDSSSRVGHLSPVVSTSTFQSDQRPDTVVCLDSRIYFENGVDIQYVDYVKSKDTDHVYLYLYAYTHDTITSHSDGCSTHYLQKYDGAGNLVGIRTVPFESFLSINHVVDENGGFYYSTSEDRFLEYNPSYRTSSDWWNCEDSVFIYCSDTMGNLVKVATLEKHEELISFDVAGNSLVFISRDTCDGSQKIQRLLLEDGEVIYSKREDNIVSDEYACFDDGYLNLRMNSYSHNNDNVIELDDDGTAYVHSGTFVRVFDPAGQEVSMIKSFKPAQGEIVKACSYIHSLYLTTCSDGDCFKVYDFSNVMKYWSSTVNSWFYSIGKEGDIYMISGNSTSSYSGIILRLKNPIQNDDADN